MAKIGLSKPRAATYSVSDGAVSYSDPIVLGKYTAFSMDVGSTNNNDLYADNAIAETDPTFQNGTCTLTTDDLSAAIMASVLGLTSEPVDPDDDENESTWMVWDNAQSVPYLGIGGVIKRKQGGSIIWQGFVLPKVQFQNPALSLETQGETISWQTQEIVANIMRSDAADERWFMMTSEFETEAEADAAVLAFLSPVEEGEGG